MISVKDLGIKKKEIVLYLITGVLTTFLTYIVYYVGWRYLIRPKDSLHEEWNQWLAWGIGVLFSYIAKRKIVFASKNSKMLGEFAGYIALRVMAVVMDAVIMWMFSGLFEFDFLFTKLLISSTCVLCTDFVICKYFLFVTKEERINRFLQMKDLLIKNREIVIYVMVGLMTTVVSWVVCFVGKHYFFDVDNSLQSALNNILGWVAGVLFAYPTNRKWVFESKDPRVIKEFTGFAGSRVSTMFLDLVIMWFFHNLLCVNYNFSKICISSVLVTVANYVISKYLVFEKKEKV